MRTASRVSTADAAGMDRLLRAIQQSHAGTVEFWASFDTVYPLYRGELGSYVSTLFAWDLPGAPKDTRRNLTLTQFGTGMTLSPRDVPVAIDANLNFAFSIRTGLVHMLISWDGAKTTLYKNGELYKAVTLPWNVEKMTPGSLLVLGNNTENAFPYLGTCYFLAFHDKALTAEDAKRHYLAGPSGR